MATPHNEANLGDFAKTVIMPGDPKRAEFIAKNYFKIMYLDKIKYRIKNKKNNHTIIN